MAHIGFTPQSEHSLGGYRVQGRGDDRAHGCSPTRRRSRRPARSPSCMEMVPGDVAAEITKELAIPTIGIGAGVECDAPGAGLAGHGRAAHRPDGAVRQAVRRPARRAARAAAQEYAADVAAGTFPGPEHTF